MRSFIRKYLSILVIVLALVYAGGDHFKLWDSLTGRTTILQAWDRLTFSRGGLKIVIFDDEPLFEELCDFIEDRSMNDSIRVRRQIGSHPTAIARMGDTQTPAIGDHRPGWPEFWQALQTSPVIFIYGHTRSQISSRAGFPGDQTYFACTLRDLRDWVNESRGREWFLVSTLLVGLLSLAVAILEKRKEPVGNSSSR
jgi:hypothetical protein